MADEIDEEMHADVEDFLRREIDMQNRFKQLQERRNVLAKIKNKLLDDAANNPEFQKRLAERGKQSVSNPPEPKVEPLPPLKHDGEIWERAGFTSKEEFDAAMKGEESLYDDMVNEDGFVLTNDEKELVKETEDFVNHAEDVQEALDIIKKCGLKS